MPEPFEPGIEHPQPWELRDQRTVQHSHAFHIRYDHTALARQGLHRVRLATTAGSREFYRFDPLGLELVLAGTIRGERVKLGAQDGRELRGVTALANQLSVQTFDYAPSAVDQNTQRLAVVAVTPGR